MILFAAIFSYNFISIKIWRYIFRTRKIHFWIILDLCVYLLCHKSLLDHIKRYQLKQLTKDKKKTPQYQFHQPFF